MILHITVSDGLGERVDLNDFENPKNQESQLYVKLRDRFGAVLYRLKG